MFLLNVSICIEGGVQAWSDCPGFIIQLNYYTRLN